MFSKETITDTKHGDKLMKENKLELKKTIEMIKQNTCEAKKPKKHNTGISNLKPRKRSKRRTITKDGKIRYKTVRTP